MKKKIIKVAIKVVVGFAFTGLLLVNGTAFVKTSDGKTGSLIASAFADVENPNSPHGQTCGKDDCAITLGVGGTSISANGHYFHCQTTNNNTQSCNSTSCTTKCDAKIVAL